MLPLSPVGLACALTESTDGVSLLLLGPICIFLCSDHMVSMISAL